MTGLIIHYTYPVNFITKNASPFAESLPAYTIASQY